MTSHPHLQNGIPGYDVIVIGGGVVGCSIAYHLAKSGARVVVLERWRIAAGASGASAGGVRHQGRDMREFSLAFAAIERWQTLEEELGADLEYRRDGHATTAEDPADAMLLDDSVQQQRAAGLDIRLLQGHALHEIIPGIAPTVLAAAYSPNDGHANPTLTTQAFAYAAERYKAHVRTGFEVDMIATSGGRISGVHTSEGALAADTVVLAAGAWSGTLASRLGVELHVSPDAYQAMTTFPMEPHLKPVLGSMRRLISLKQLPDGRYLLGGGWPGTYTLDEPRGQNLEENILANVAAAVGVLPDVARAVIDQAWIGIDAHGHDEVPVLGAIEGVDGLVVATGFSGHGFALAPAVGEAIAALILTGRSPIDISDLLHSRFDDLTTGPSSNDHAG